MPVRAAFLALATSAALGAIAGDPGWPPSPQARARIDELRRTIGDATATPAQRQSAREELMGLIRHPAAPAPPVARKPARAAVEPAPRLPAPAAAAPPKPPGAATPAPAAPALRLLPDGRGSVLVPAGPNAIDPRTGAHLIDVGNGYLDPATGRFVPKP